MSFERIWPMGLMEGNVLGIFSASELVIYSAYLLTFTAVFLVAQFFLAEEESRLVSENLDNSRGKKSSNPLVSIARPFLIQYIVPLVRGRALWDNRRLIYRRKLISAGLRDEMTSDELIAFKFFLILFFPIATGILKSLELFSTEFYYYPIVAVLGWYYPDFWLNSTIRVRQKKILKMLPFVVDLLALSTEAGLDFIGAIQKVVEKAKSSPLIDELEQVLKELRVGSSRAGALRELAIRVDISQVNSFIAILISSDQMGASIGKILRQQSEQIRNQRFVAAEKAGAQAATKLLGPLVFIILPAIMLLVFGPMMIGGGLS